MALFVDFFFMDFYIFVYINESFIHLIWNFPQQQQEFQQHRLKAYFENTPEFSTVTSHLTFKLSRLVKEHLASCWIKILKYIWNKFKKVTFVVIIYTTPREHENSLTEIFGDN